MIYTQQKTLVKNCAKAQIGENTLSETMQTNKLDNTHAPSFEKHLADTYSTMLVLGFSHTALAIRKMLETDGVN